MTTRADMAASLSLDPSLPAKTFVLEVHTDDPAGHLTTLVGAKAVEPTDDAFLYRLRHPAGQFWVDQLDQRYWSFHTDMAHDSAYRILRNLVSARSDLDWMWLPSAHLRNIWPGATSRRVHTAFEGRGFLDPSVAARDLKVQLTGQGANELLDLIERDPRYRPAVSFSSVQVFIDEPEFGTVTEGVNRKGQFKVTGDFEFHLQFVRAVVQRYRRLVSLCEQRTVEWKAFADGGGRLSGRPITIQFSRRIEDLERFLDELFSCRDPFRLWGVPEMDAGVAHVEAVDLHVGDHMRIDVSPEWMRVYLNRGSCGNTIARLISNLQHGFDGALTVADPEIQAAVEARPHSSGQVA